MRSRLPVEPAFEVSAHGGRIRRRTFEVKRDRRCSAVRVDQTDGGSRTVRLRVARLAGAGVFEPQEMRSAQIGQASLADPIGKAQATVLPGFLPLPQLAFDPLRFCLENAFDRPQACPPWCGHGEATLIDLQPDRLARTAREGVGNLAAHVAEASRPSTAERPTQAGQFHFR